MKCYPSDALDVRSTCVAVCALKGVFLEWGFGQPLETRVHLDAVIFVAGDPTHEWAAQSFVCRLPRSRTHLFVGAEETMRCDSFHIPPTLDAHPGMGTDAAAGRLVDLTPPTYYQDC